MAENPVDKAKRETPNGCVRFWASSNYGGPGVSHWDYNPSAGYEDVPRDLHDHAYSFYSKVRRDVTAINWTDRSNGEKSNRETRIIHNGDHRWNWDFGDKLDAVEPMK